MPIDFSFLQRCADPECGFDLVIVVTGSEASATWWRNRLGQTAGSVVPGARVLVVHERWNGRPGNALGTLNALAVAHEALSADGAGLWERLQRGQRVGVWHTAGQGKRLYPLPLAHHGDKSRTWVPGMVSTPSGAAPMTLLEAVLRQCSALAEPSRVWVFWGDQLIGPSVPVTVPDADVVLLGRGGIEPCKRVWEAGGLHAYGVLAIDAHGRAAQLEKLSWERFYAVREALPEVHSVATSLGSFCVTASMAHDLCVAYAERLASRTGLMDTDPDWWMPMTLPDGLARRLLGDARVDAFRATGIRGTLRVADVGHDASWWDFGTLAAWHRSCRAVLVDADLRSLLGTPEPVRGSVCVASEIGDVRDAVVVGTIAPNLRVHGGVVVACDGASGHVAGAAYGVHGALAVGQGDVVCTDGWDGTVTASLDHDGKASWAVVLPGNPGSWSALSRYSSEK